MFGRVTAACLAAALMAQGCSVVERRSPEERYCRDALDVLAGRRGVSVDDASTSLRDLNRERVTAVTLTYEQGPVKRLMTCFFRGGDSRPMRINYRGRPLSPAQLRRVDARIRS